MALKRSLDDSPWGYEFQLYGTHFHHANERALVTTFGISLVATFGIAIRAIFVRRNNRPLRWGILAFSILLSIIYLGNSFARIILVEEEATVKNVYLLVNTILDSSVHLADISLLGFIYIIIAACLQDLGVKVATKTALKVSFFAVINILIAFWATVLALQIKDLVNSVTNPGDFDPDNVFVWIKLEITYYAIFVCASIELLVLALWIISGQRRQGNPTWIGVFLASLVAIPLLIRSLFNLGFLAAGLTRDIKSEALVADTFIFNICFVIAYMGVLLVAMRFKRERAGSGYPGKLGAPQMSPGTWTNPAPVQHQTYPPQGSQYGASNPPVLGNGTALHRGAPFGNSSHGSPQQSPNGTTLGYGNPQNSKNDAVTAYQAQNQYNAQHSPVSPS